MNKNLQTLDEFRNHPGDPLSYVNIHGFISKPDGQNIVSLVNIDTEEEIDGYTSEEISEIILYLQYIKTRLDTIEESENSPGLFDGGDDNAKEETNTRGMG
tara:strand:+ start:269 stop:571 length:303 start_codon:yes stop_codon:yes gene_type:complete